MLEKASTLHLVALSCALRLQRKWNVDQHPCFFFFLKLQEVGLPS